MRPPAPSSTRLSTEAQGDFSARGFAPEKPSPLPPTPSPVPGPVPEQFLDEPPSHPILFLILFRRGPKPSLPHTLFLSVRGSWTDWNWTDTTSCSCSQSCPGGPHGRTASIPGSRSGEVRGQTISTSCFCH
ncbi:hypothetical protein CHARACLAT_027813 [Characodon lateralis]|uniref:Uncharacterized protein n=1 Tax=Characodon lateralis TaxID=208331 RepID=A0ABU7DAL6_9TELE|nr:hypothetical protein [Characodon lateralis]